jgi:hypothetical protein
MTKISNLLDSNTDAAMFYERADIALATSVDSLKIRIPAKLVNIKCPELTDSEILKVNSSTGRIIGTAGTNKTTYEYSTGVLTPYSHELMRVSRTPQDFVTVGLSSKLLKGKYFEGITIDNIELVHNELLKQKIIDCSLSSLLENGVCTDIDIKQDLLFNSDLKAFKQSLKVLQLAAKKTSKKGGGARLFTDKGNIGIEFSDRRSTAYKTAPYLKVYHKGQELLSKSYKFANTHLDNFNFSSIVRVEATIKNKKHFNSLFDEKYETATLETVLSLTASEKQKVLDTAYAAHISSKRIARERDMREGIPEDILKGQDKIIYRLMQMLIQDGKQFDVIVKEILSMYSGASCKVQRSRYKKKMSKLYELMTREKEQAFCPVLNLFFN